MANKRIWSSVLAIILLALAVLYVILPRPLFSTPTSFVIEDNQGNLLNASIAADGQWRFPLSEELPDKFVQCLIHFEDKRFFHHPGVDPIALVRAMKQNIQGERVVSGASTISMQVIRLSRNKPRTIIQKIIEMLMAFSLEMQYSKSSILKLYSGNAPFGGNVVGLEAAAWRYFGRSPERLSWAESATLAVLPNAPSLIHPGRNRQMLLAKRNRLLDVLAAKDIISVDDAELSKLEPLPDQPLALPQFAPHLLERFRKETNARPQIETSIQTTVDGDLQQKVNEILNRYHHRNRANGILNAAALVVDVAAGHVRAYVGNVGSPDDPEQEYFVDIISARRSPGSTLKPFLYAAMLHDGLLLPHTLVPDIPTQIGGYTPQNFDLAYDGAVPADQTLSRSLNIPMVRMLQQYRYQRFHSLLQNIGITTMEQPADHYGLSMILGGSEVTMWQLTSVYASLARTLNNYQMNKGAYNPQDYHAVDYKIRDTDAIDTHRTNSMERSSHFDYASLYFTFQAMREVMRPGDEALWEQFSSSRQIAWKTGTSFGFRDGWAIGLTPDHVVCVWVGNADGEGRPGLTGIQTAAPILFEIFNQLPNNGRWFDAPTDFMIQAGVCRESGHLAGADCIHVDTTYIPATGFKSAVCPYHHEIHTNLEGTYRVTQNCADAGNIKKEHWFTLPPTMAYYYLRKNSFYKEPPPFAPGCQLDLHSMMEMIYPRNFAKIYLPLGQDGQRGEVIFTVAHQQSNRTVYWHMDNQYVAETFDKHQQSFLVAPGKHILTVVDESGNRLESHFEILEKHNDVD